MARTFLTAPVQKNRLFIIAVAILICNVCFIALYNISSISIALPLLMEAFDASMTLTQWISIGYALAMGATMPLAGHFMRLFSIKKSFILCLAFYTLLSALSGCTPSLILIIICRALQGLAGALLVPATMVIIYQFIPRRYQTLFLTLQNVSLSLAPALAPIIAGALIAQLNWRWIFWINVPIGLVSVLIAVRFLPIEKLEDKVPIDWLSFIMVIIGCLAIFLSVSLSSTKDGLSAPVLVLFITGLGLVFLFWQKQKKTSHPILDFAVLSYREYRLTLLGHILSTVLFAASPFIFAILLQIGKGYSSGETASFMFVPALFAIVGAPIAQKLYRIFPSKIVIMVSWTFLIVGSLTIGLFSHLPLYALLTLLAAQYLGLGMIGMPLTDHGMRDLPPAKSNDAATLLNWLCSLMTGLSVSIFTAIYERLNTHFSLRLPTDLASLSSTKIIYVIIGLTCVAGLISALPLVKKVPDRY